MKKNIIVTSLLLAGLFAACSSTGEDKTAEKAKMDEVMSIHNAVMGKSELVIKYKAQLDSFTMKNKADTMKTYLASGLKSKLVMADEAMETWMHQFNPDFSGKPHAEIMSYLETQKKQIHRVDSILTQAIDKTGKLLNAK